MCPKAIQHLEFSDDRAGSDEFSTSPAARFTATNRCSTRDSAFVRQAHLFDGQNRVEQIMVVRGWGNYCRGWDTQKHVHPEGASFGRVGEWEFRPGDRRNLVRRVVPPTFSAVAAGAGFSPEVRSQPPQCFADHEVTARRTRRAPPIASIRAVSVSRAGASRHAPSCTQGWRSVFAPRTRLDTVPVDPVER